MIISAIKKRLRSFSSKKRKKANEWFFKTGKGEYGYGDSFIGVSVPDIRKVAALYKELKLSQIKILLKSKIHEERLTAIIILVNKYKIGTAKEKEQIYHFYLKNFKYVNNWDLVDTSAHKIVGEYLMDHPVKMKILNRYASSDNLWEKRLSVIATFPMINARKFNWSINIAESLLYDTNDLTHKAVGWMLREVWKRDHKIVENFLVKNYRIMPRTTLRCAIERMGKNKRKQFLNKN